jgi:hypothetical protein
LGVDQRAGAEYLGRVYDEVRRRPSYIVGNAVGFDRSFTAADAADPEEASAPPINGRARA